MNNLYPIWVSLTAMMLAQLIKPIVHYLRTKKWELTLLFDSGGLPSSHSSMVSALALSVGLLDNFDSTMFAVTVVFAIITMYDAANIRLYAGRNIQITRKLIEDLRIIHKENEALDHPIYHIRIKEILGHNWLEVFTGAIMGLIIAAIAYNMFK